jgi:hypothetical protein
MRNGLLSLSMVELLLLVACRSNTAAVLDSRVGQMTYEEAVQNFGPPTECTDQGKTKKCTWINWPGQLRYQQNTGVVQMGVATDPPVAMLTFTKGVLTEWTLSGNWK